MSVTEEFEKWRGGRYINYLDSHEAFVVAYQAGIEAAAIRGRIAQLEGKLVDVEILKLKE